MLIHTFKKCSIDECLLEVGNCIWCKKRNLAKSKGNWKGLRSHLHKALNLSVGHIFPVDIPHIIERYSSYHWERLLCMLHRHKKGGLFDCSTSSNCIQSFCTQQQHWSAVPYLSHLLSKMIGNNILRLDQELWQQLKFNSEPTTTGLFFDRIWGKTGRNWEKLEFCYKILVYQIHCLLHSM